MVHDGGEKPGFPARCALIQGHDERVFLYKKPVKNWWQEGSTNWL